MAVIKNLQVILCFFLTGCATTGFYYSKPVENNRLYKFYRNGIVLFNLDRVNLFLSPINHSSFDAGFVIPPLPIVIGNNSLEEFYYPENYFKVEILLHSEQEGFCFNPKEVYLILEKGDTLQPVKYFVREGTAYWPLGKDPHNLLRSHFSDKKENIESSVDKYYDSVKDENKWGIGFVVYFSTSTPKPGTTFTIEIKGLKYFDQNISVPKVEYKDKSKYTWTHFT